MSDPAGSLQEVATAKPDALQERPLSTTVAEISPDDLIIVQKRQDWRLRVAHVCLDFFEAAEPGKLAGERLTAREVAALGKKLSRISDFVRRDLPVLLVTGITVNELEAERYQANYFLEEIVRHLRQNVQSRSKTKSPLESLEPEQVRVEVAKSLDTSLEALLVFIEAVVKLAEFEIEVNAQRERIRLLLGGDRRLSTLGNNETIMTAGFGHLWRLIDDFVGVYGYLRTNLPPLLERASPYEALDEELKAANEQLRMLLRDRVLPFEDRVAFKRSQDRALTELGESLNGCLQAAKEVLEVRVLPLRSELKKARPSSRVQEINNLNAATVALTERLVGLPAAVFLPQPESRNAARGESTNDPAELNKALEEVLSQMLRLRRTALAERGESEEMPEGEALVDLLRESHERLRSTQQALDQGVAEVQVLREEKLRILREHFCSLMGELRTFLQTSFAHIAAKDPRSTESSYHFFLREFSDEAHQALLLLREIRELEALINNLQSFNIAGLPLTPENLSRILRVLFVDKAEEKKHIPSGEGWKVMASFLEKLKNELVPRLQRVCAMDGIRFEDKNFLSEWAMDLSQGCALCLAQHEIGYSLTKEIGRLRGDSTELVTSRETYAHIVTAKTCKEMQESLTEICMTLTASIPYVGIMRGGIERRASVFFHRQQKVLKAQGGSFGAVALS